jgi:hypothetical protein
MPRPAPQPSSTPTSGWLDELDSKMRRAHFPVMTIAASPMRSQVVRRVGDDRPQKRAFLRAAAVVSRIDVAAPRLKRSRTRGCCFDGRAGASPWSLSGCGQALAVSGACRAIVTTESA